jgi:MarR family transcriptional regulator, organic hydroperoxide resistance regulator
MSLMELFPAKEDLVRLDNQVCFLLYACSRAMTGAYQPLLERLQLTYPQYLVMMVLWEWHDQHGADTVKALGKRLHLDSGTLTPLLKRLEQQGLVLRQRDTEDERRVLVSATPEGIALRQVAIAFLSDHCQVPDGIDPAELRRQLQRLLAALHDGGGHPIPAHRNDN